jgi:hypothetical protein
MNKSVRKGGVAMATIPESNALPTPKELREFQANLKRLSYYEILDPTTRATT